MFVWQYPHPLGERDCPHHSAFRDAEDSQQARQAAVKPHQDVAGRAEARFAAEQGKGGYLGLRVLGRRREGPGREPLILRQAHYI